MPGLVIDASVILAAVLPDETDHRAETAWAMAVSKGIFVPSHWPLEVANGLISAQRRRRISDADRRETISDLMAMSIFVDDSSLVTAWKDVIALAVRHTLTAYDAAYLELALRADLPLATLDDELYLAARKAKAQLID